MPVPDSGGPRTPRLRAWRLAAAALLLLAVFAGHAWAAGGADGAGAPGHALLWLAVILIAAQLGGEAASRAGQPPVLGELIAGIAIGNLPLVGITALQPIATDASIDLLARLGVLLLLFEVGLGSTVAEMLEVGASAVLVAALGVIAPFALGWLVGAWLLPDAGRYVHVFLGATLSATSVGITARVLDDLGEARSVEARVILGAAVVDDVFGLVILAVVTGLIASAGGGALSGWAVAGPVVKAGVFLVAAFFLGTVFARRLFSAASRLRSRGVLLACGLGFCFVLSWAAEAIGLAPIVGAFAAGLLLEETHSRRFVERGEPGLEALVRPITSFMAPVFFVLMGIKTDARVLADPQALALGAALLVAAIVGKQACSLGVWGGIDRLSVGIGMIPRGEVGLIFANVGLGLQVAGRPVIGAMTFSAIVLTVVATSLITPPLLEWSFRRRRRAG